MKSPVYPILITTPEALSRALSCPPLVLHIDEALCPYPLSVLSAHGYTGQRSGDHGVFFLRRDFDPEAHQIYDPFGIL